MKYLVTDADVELYFHVCKKNTPEKFRDATRIAIQSVVDGIPDSADPKWIKIENAMINVDTIIWIEDMKDKFTIWTNANVEGSDGVWSIRNLDAIKALRAFFFDSGRFPFVDLTPKRDA